MADTRLKVDTEKLRRTYAEFSDTLREIRLHAVRIGGLSAKTRGYWRGDAGERDRDGYAFYRDDILDAAQRLEKRAQSLLEMAGVYEKSEKVTEESGMSVEIIW